MAILHTFILNFVLFSSVLLPLSCCWYKVKAHGGESVEIAVDSLLPATNCISSSKGFDHHKRLQLVDMNGPCSPLGKTALSPEEILHKDQLRVRSIHSMINKQVRDSKAKIPTSSGRPFDSRNYVVNIGIGTPQKKFWVTMDTGSSLTWILCQPCPNCRGPIFFPSQSSSYSNVACGSAECSQVYSATHYSPRCSIACVYETQYTDRDFSIGLFVRETLRLTPSDVFPGFKFGCGHNVSLQDSTSGLLGLGPQPISLVSQTATKFGKVFSYCLPRSENSNGFLAFGNQTGATSSAVKYTQLIINPRNLDFYFVPLIGISVNGQRLAIPPSTFSNPGTVIDSGTVISRLPPLAYRTLRNVFNAAMSHYPSAPGIGPFDACYDFSRNETVMVPSIVLHFGGGADIQLDSHSGILVNARLSQPSQFCLAFFPNDNVRQKGILGNMQQRTYEVIYDLPRGRLGFRSVGTTC